MTQSIVITLPGPPRGKGRPRFVRSSGRVYTPAETESYEGQIRLVARRAMGNRPPIEGAVEVEIIAGIPIPASWSKKKQASARNNTIHPVGKPDVDNYAKILMDSINHIVWRDDAQVAKLSCIKRYSDTPHLEARIRTIGENL